MPSREDLYGPVHQSDEEREARRRARHKLWLESFSGRDWERLRAQAEQVTENDWPARLDDLDAPGIAAGVCPVGWETRYSGERVGTLRGGEVALLVWWPK